MSRTPAPIRPGAVAALLLTSFCGGAMDGTTGSSAPEPGANRRVALTDLVNGSYMGIRGGLYSGSNQPPAGHASLGLAAAAHIQPLDTRGQPSANGRYVLLSIGMSNTTQEFCSQGGGLPCDSWTFTGQAAADPQVDRTRLVIANGAMGGRTASAWDSPSDPDYDRVRDTVLAPQGLSEAQVQIAWVKVANAGPSVALPSPQADAYVLVQQIGNIARTLKTRYPNIRQVFFSSRIYAGYATTTLNPEPYAYESGLAVKLVVQAQVRQMENLGIDPRAGDLAVGTAAPWLAWGPYLWADGLNARSDGLVWQRADLVGDGTHPTRSGETKVGALLLAFFKGSPFSSCWFLAGATCS